MANGNDVSMELVNEGLNDVEHPGFLNSSLFSDNDENLNESMSTPPSPRGKAIEEISYDALPPRPPSFETFVGACRKAIMSNVSQRPPTTISTEEFKDLHSRTWLTNSAARQEALLETINKKKEKQEQLEALKESVSQLMDEKKKLQNDLMKIKPVCEKKVENAKKEWKKVEKVFKKGEEKLRNQLAARDKYKERVDKAKSLYEKVFQEDQQLTNWLSDHSLKINVGEENSAEGEIVVQLLDPRNPEEKFYILIDSIIPQTGYFYVRNVFPEFDDAHSIIERANVNQNFLQLLRECKKTWQNYLAQKSLTESVKT